MCRDIVDKSGKDAALGTVQHYIGEQCLSRDWEPEKFLGDTLSIIKAHDSDEELVLLGESTNALFSFKVTAEMVENVRTYVSGVRRVHGTKMYERRIDTSRVLGVEGEKGTADAAILNHDEKLLEVHDAKFGFNKVDAEDNEQGILYLAGLLDEFELMDDWKGLKFVIHQPRIGHYDHHTYTPEQVKARAADLAEAGQKALALLDAPREEVLKHLTPGPKQCEWCPVRGSCVARSNRVKDMFETLAGDKVEPGVLTDNDIADSVRRIDEIEGWCKDIRAEALRRALLGHQLKGQKVVQGKKGARAWRDEAAAEQALDLLLSPDQLYEPAQIISPTAVERLLGKDVYQTVADVVIQAEGGLSLAPESDKRPAVKITQPEFH